MKNSANNYKQNSYLNNKRTDQRNTNNQNTSRQKNNHFAAAPIVVFLLGSIILVLQFSWCDQIWQSIAVPSAVVTGIWSYFRYKKTSNK